MNKLSPRLRILSSSTMELCVCARQIVYIRYNYDVINAHREPSTSAVLPASGSPCGLREPLSFEKRDTRYVCFSGREERHFFNAVYMIFI